MAFLTRSKVPPCQRAQPPHFLQFFNLREHQEGPSGRVIVYSVALLSLTGLQVSKENTGAS
jgi:hypothetical protein